MSAPAGRSLQINRLWPLGWLICRRLLSGALVLLASATVTFFALRLTPGDPVRAVLGGPTANPTPETVARAIAEFGLDRPLPVQYLLHIGRLLRGDLGTSFSQHQQVSAVIAEQIGPTLWLTGSAVAVAWLLSTLSVLATARRGWALSAVGSAAETMAAALPQFWLGLVLLAVFAFGLRWFPPQSDGGFLGMVLPTLALAVPLAGFLAQVTRESFELALDQPFILSARMRGLGEGAVRWRHGLRHAALPGISLSAWAIGSLIGNAVLVEVIFSRPGLGRVLYQAVSVQDMPLTIGVTLVVTLVYVVASLAVDLLYILVDPRLKAKRT
ncbi:ABC transporter permease [Xaviernesmea oryzae]|uniref:ABC transporter permease n=1 Tax=Xaviernesmea oryzae TaxID=464029 RepID=A0A1Q9B1Y4_9HYPH|nr:ABC transporter permease [Xaviernesmea oryzae]OLP62024.1 ABC transporter permease [Xaviernesmea oryzae]SEK96565.1 peptide/nickel transport system permease protein [Xaviernesmea oryzae]